MTTFDPGVSTQETLPGLEPPTPRRVAFGGFVKTEIYDLFGEHDLGALSDAEKHWMNPDNLTRVLFDPPKDGQLVVDGLGLNPHEHNLVLRAHSPEYLAKAAFAKTLGANDLDDERIAAAERSSVHTLKSKQESMMEHEAKLRETRQDIKRLERRAKAPGYAHESPEEMARLIGEAWLEFTIILDVAHAQRGWDDERRRGADAALVHYLTRGPQRTRVGHWQSMLDLADRYLGARINLFRKRTIQIQALLTETHAESAQ